MAKNEDLFDGEKEIFLKNFLYSEIMEARIWVRFRLALKYFGMFMDELGTFHVTERRKRLKD